MGKSRRDREKAKTRTARNGTGAKRVLVSFDLSQCVGGSAVAGDSDDESVASEATHFTLVDDLESIVGEGLCAFAMTKL